VTGLSVVLGWGCVAGFLAEAISFLLGLRHPHDEWALVLLGLPMGDLLVSATQSAMLSSRLPLRGRLMWIITLPLARLAGSLVVVTTSGEDWRAMPTWWGLIATAGTFLALVAWPVRPQPAPV
jgi:hypothetical protein